MTDQPRIPRFVKVTAALTVAGVAGAATVAWQLADLRAEQRQRDCDRAVVERVNDRAMWVWLGDQFPVDATELGLHRELDDRLPTLHCVGGDPLPITEEP